MQCVHSCCYQQRWDARLGQQIILGYIFPLHPGSIWGYEGAGRYLGHSSHITHPRSFVTISWHLNSGHPVSSSYNLQFSLKAMRSHWMVWLEHCQCEYMMVMVYSRRETHFSLSTSVCVLTQHLAVAGHRVGGAWAGFHKITVPHTRYWLRWGCGRTLDDSYRHLEPRHVDNDVSSLMWPRQTLGIWCSQ